MSNTDSISATSSNLYAEVPTIDLNPFFYANEYNDSARDAVVKKVIDATTQLGFMNIIGHGIPTSLIDSGLTVAHEFFEQNIDIKLKSTGGSTTSAGYSIRGNKTYNRTGDGKHFKEIFDMGPPITSSLSPFQQNIYPLEPKRFQSVMEAYYCKIEHVEKILFQVLSLALGQIMEMNLSIDFLEKEKGRHRGLLRINYFPKCDFMPEPGAMRDGAHTDWTPFTILFTEKEGLEVMQNGQWCLVPLTPGAFTVNIGDQLHRWSNGRFKSSIHRVNANHCRDSSRISLVYFGTESIDPTDETVIIPLCASGELPHFEPLSIKNYVLYNFRSISLKKNLTDNETIP